MAVAPKDMPVDRVMVQSWIDDYNKKKNPPDTLEQYIHKEVSKLNLDDPYVDTSAYDDLEDETHIADMVCMDLPSYATSN